jgi:hypothetical protein
MEDDGGWLEMGERIFEIRNCKWDSRSFRINLKEESDVHRKAGLQSVSAHCDLPFKGTLCDYDGDDTRCLKTWADCKSKSNVANFRGFRFVPHPGFRLNLDRTHYIYVPANSGERNLGVDRKTPTEPPPRRIDPGGRRIPTG